MHSVHFLCPDAKHLLQRMSVQDAQVGFIRHAGKIRGKIDASLLHIFFHPLRIAFPVLVGQRGADQIIALHGILFIDKIHLDAKLPEGSEMGKHRIHIGHIFPRALDILHRPPVFPVEQDRRPGPVAGGRDRVGDPLQPLAQRGNLPEHPGIASVSVIDHSSVEFFLPASALSPLEILHAVGAAGHGLKGGQLMHARTLLGVHFLPVHKGRRAFH